MMVSVGDTWTEEFEKLFIPFSATATSNILCVKAATAF